MDIVLLILVNVTALLILLVIILLHLSLQIFYVYALKKSIMDSEESCYIPLILVASPIVHGCLMFCWTCTTLNMYYLFG